MFFCVVKKGRMKNYGFRKVGIRSIGIDNSFDVSTLGYQFDPSIRWNIVVSRFHLIDGF